MLYTKNDYPSPMKNLNPELRNKAIDILNALVEEKQMEIGYAIPTAISRAKDWAANRNKPVVPSPSDQKKHGDDVYVLPHEGDWAIKKEKAKKASFVMKNKTEAVSKARNIARRNNGSVIIHRKSGGIQTKISYTQQ